MRKKKEPFLTLCMVKENAFHVIATVEGNGEVTKGLEATKDEFTAAMSFFNTYNLEEKLRK